MSKPSVDRQLELLMRGCEHCFTAEELKARLASGKKLRVKLGMDPTAPDLTLGHTVVLRKLRQFQNLGHTAVLIIGDYTARIGDPSGKSKTRPMLTVEQVEENAATYMRQAGKVLDLSQGKFEVRHNSEWLEPMTCADVLRLMSQMTVARMMERDTFATRQAAGKEIFMHELLYPLMQGRDSVAIEADVELGGTDQTFNNLCGRDLQRNAGQPPQIVMTLPLLVGTDGKQKMSKSLGNYVAVTDTPSDMFGKIMRIPDPLMRSYFELLTDTPQDEIAALTEGEGINPRDTKEHLARMIITQYHSVGAAEAAAQEFKRVHAGGGQSGLPDDVPDVVIPAEMIEKGKVDPTALTVYCFKEKSRGVARRLIQERGVRLNGKVIEDPQVPVAVKTGDVFQRGKRKFVRIRIP